MPVSREEDFWRNDVFSLYDFYGHTLAQEPLPGGHEIYNLVKHFLGHYYYILRLSDLCLGAKKKIFEKDLCISLYDLHSHTLAQEPLPRGSWNLQLG